MGGRTLVTGATGFIGSHLVRSLVADGHGVRALVRPGDARGFGGPDVEVVEGDVRDARAVGRALRGCSQVFHLASGSHATHDAREHLAVNLGGTRNVAAASLAAGVERLVHASTAGVYGRTRTGPVDEDAPRRPNTHYRATKHAAERHLEARHAADALPVVIARITDTVGAGALSWLGLCRAIATPGFRCIGAGRNVNQLVHVGDVVDGLRRCAARGVPGRAYLVSGPRAVAVSEIVAWITEDLGVAAPGRPLPAAPFAALDRLGDLLHRTLGVEVPRLQRHAFFVTEKAYDLSRARRELAFEPRVAPRDGMRETVAWYRECGLLPSP